MKGDVLLLAATSALALHTRIRLIPNLTDDNLRGLAWHIRGITALAIAFVGELGMVPLEGCRQPQAGGVADASRGDAVRTDSHGKRRLRAGLPSCQSVWQRFWPPFCPRTCSTPATQRADLHAADRCGTCLRVNPQPPAGELQRRRATGCGCGDPPGRDRAPGSRRHRLAQTRPRRLHRCGRCHR